MTPTDVDPHIAARKRTLGLFRPKTSIAWIAIRSGHRSAARRKIEPTCTAVQTPTASRRNAARHRLITAAPLSVSTCAAKVRASLLKARFALSCCGITPLDFLILEKIETDRPADFLILQEQKTDPPPVLKIFRTRNARLCRRGQNQRPGNGDFDEHLPRFTPLFWRCALGRIVL
jgi:hypothetical protein